MVVSIAKQFIISRFFKVINIVLSQTQQIMWDSLNLLSSYAEKETFFSPLFSTSGTGGKRFLACVSEPLPRKR